MSKRNRMGLILLMDVSIDLPSDAVLIISAEEGIAFVVLAVGVDRLCPEDSLVVVSFARPCSADVLPKGSHRPLRPSVRGSWGPLGRALGALGGVLEARGGVWEALGRSWEPCGKGLRCSRAPFGHSRSLPRVVQERSKMSLRDLGQSPIARRCFQ